MNKLIAEFNTNKYLAKNIWLEIKKDKDNTCAIMRHTKSTVMVLRNKFSEFDCEYFLKCMIDNINECSKLSKFANKERSN